MTTNSTNISISGLKAATKDMEVISNNIANANTVGFKRSRSNFSDIYANGLLSNDMGLGVTVSSVSQIFTQGAVELTGRTLDLRLNNDGFFQLNNGTGSNNSLSYTRAGNFSTDNQGYVQNPTGQRVQGYLYSNGVKTGGMGDIQIPVGNQPANPTSTMSLNVNLDANSTAPSVTFSPSNASSYNFKTTQTVYDSLGVSHDLTAYFAKQTTPANTWSMYQTLDNGTPSSAQTVAFNASGALTTSMPLSSSFAVTTGATTPLQFTVNLTGSTQYGSTSLVNSSSQNGYPSGVLSAVSVDNSGVLSALYTNGQVNPIAQFVVVTFAAPEGLQPINDNQWLATSDSGPALIQSENPAGSIQSGSLETSNVDTTEELVNLLKDQRLYQANAQAVQIAQRTIDVILGIIQ